MNSPYQIIPIAATATSFQTAESLASGDLSTALMQLGIGGILVVFGASIYRRFEGRADAAADTYKADLDAERRRFDEELAAERARHDETRNQLIDALRNPLPVNP